MERRREETRETIHPCPAQVDRAVPKGNSDAPCAVFCMADSRVGIDGFAAAAARGFKYERLDYPRHLKRRARFANPGQLSRLNTHSIHLLYRA